MGARVGLFAGRTAAITAAPAATLIVASLGLVTGAMPGATLRAYVRLLCRPFVRACRMHRVAIDVRRS